MCSQEKKSVCDTVKKCPECCKQVRTISRKVKRGGDRKSNNFSHKCGMDNCNNCKQFVEVALHQCYIQPVNPDDDEPKKKKKTKKNKRARRAIRANEGGREEEELIEPPPLFVYADYEAVTDADGVQTPIMVCAEHEATDVTEVFYG